MMESQDKKSDNLQRSVRDSSFRYRDNSGQSSAQAGSGYFAPPSMNMTPQFHEGAYTEENCNPNQGFLGYKMKESYRQSGPGYRVEERVAENVGPYGSKMERKIHQQGLVPSTDGVPMQADSYPATPTVYKYNNQPAGQSYRKSVSASALIEQQQNSCSKPLLWMIALIGIAMVTLAILWGYGVFDRSPAAPEAAATDPEYHPTRRVPAYPQASRAQPAGLRVQEQGQSQDGRQSFQEAPAFMVPVVDPKIAVTDAMNLRRGQAEPTRVASQDTLRSDVQGVRPRTSVSRDD